MADSRLQNALKQITERYPTMVPGVALKRAIELAHVEAVADLASAIRERSAFLGKRTTRSDEDGQTLRSLRKQD